MPAYLVAVYSYADRHDAETEDGLGRPGVLAESTATAIHDAPPVILAGLVKGGEIRTIRQWCDEAKTGEALCIGANGRIVDSFAPAAYVKSVLPITWYRYPEAP
jgi:hypothetical protein